MMKVFTETQIFPRHRCPVIDGTMSRLLKSIKFCSMTAQHDELTEERETSLFISSDTSVTCALLSCVSSLDYKEHKAQILRNEFSHTKHSGHCGCVYI